MELQFLILFFPSIFIPVGLFLVVMISLITIPFKLARSIITKKKKNLLPPGPWKLPFLGSIHHLILSSDDKPYITLRNLALKHGPLMHLKLGERSTIVISSPEVAKQVLKTHDHIFAQRPKLLSADILLYNSTEIVFSPYGLYWRQLRKLCTTQLLSKKRVRSFQSIREEEVGKLVRDISANNMHCAVNLSEKIRAITFAIVTRSAFGETGIDQEAMMSVVKEMVDIALRFGVGSLFPSQKWLHVLTGERRRFEEVHRKCDALLEKFINEEVCRRRSNSGEAKSLLSDLLNLRYSIGSQESPFTINNVKAVLLDVFVAGTETSTSLLLYAIWEILRNPEVLKRVQAEVRQMYNKQGYVSEKELDELMYMKAVLKETMRLHPPTPLLLPRENSEGCEINGYIIPPKTQVFVNAWAIGRDNTCWERAEEFWPERFMEREIDYKGFNFELIPFGAGRRICPGMSLALANIELPLANLLFHFDWQLHDGQATLDEDLFAIPISCYQ